MKHPVYIRSCPAKINLFLEVCGTREDGCHEIETVMQTVSIYDKITLFKNTNGIKVESNVSWLPRGEGNLAYRAAQTFFSRTDTAGGVLIRMDKHIPPGRGLGGGSSNCAGVLAGLNMMYRTGMRVEQIAGIGDSLGSDVPFFVYGGTALCKGRGEEIEPLDIETVFTYVVVLPDIHVSTKRIYQYMRSEGRYPDNPLTSEQVIAALDRGDTGLLSRSLFNRLEEPAFACFPELKTLYEELNRTGKGTYTLTGSGSAFFLPVRTREEGLEEMQRLASLRIRYNCDVVCCEGNVRGANYEDYGSEID